MSRASSNAAKRPAPRARVATARSGDHSAAPISTERRSRTREGTVPIVGVGASAGGLEAFTKLLTALPVDTGKAFVLVQHLAAQHESTLAKLLSTATQMPVTEVRRGTRVEPNHVYVIPANDDLSLADRSLRVRGRNPSVGRRLPIDYFLLSLAWTQGHRATGVILSGAGSDGALGLTAIKLAGGITFAQEPKSAQFGEMPRSAILAGCVDFVLPPEGIARELSRTTLPPRVGLSNLEKADSLLPAQDQKWMQVCNLLRDASGVDFTFYKKSTISQRIARRMSLKKVGRLSEYLTYLQGNREELDALFQDLLIHVARGLGRLARSQGQRGRVFRVSDDRKKHLDRGARRPPQSA